MLKYLAVICLVMVVAGCAASTDLESVDLPRYSKIEESSGKSSYKIENGRLEEAREFYDSEMLNKGWKKVNDATGNSGNVSWILDTWEKGGQTLLVRFLDHPNEDYLLFEDDSGRVLELSNL